MVIFFVDVEMWPMNGDGDDDVCYGIIKHHGKNYDD